MDRVPRPRIDHLFGQGGPQAIAADMIDHAAKLTTSTWLSEALLVCLDRDPLDALHDVEKLHDYLEVRFNAIVLAKGV